MNQPAIHSITALPENIAVLEKEATAEGFRFLTRLVAEWQSGANRFNRPGECLMAAFMEGQLVAIGGLTQDPFAAPDVGRLRRVFVARAFRGRNLGRRLVEQLVAHAARHFREVRLSTDSSSGAAFYSACGFQAVVDEQATHHCVLEPTRSA